MRSTSNSRRGDDCVGTPAFAVPDYVAGIYQLIYLDARKTIPFEIDDSYSVYSESNRYYMERALDSALYYSSIKDPAGGKTYRNIARLCEIIKLLKH